MEQLRLADAPYRLAGFRVPGHNANLGTQQQSHGSDQSPQRLEGHAPPATHAWPPAPPAPSANKASTQQLGYIQFMEDKPWEAGGYGKVPLEYYEQASPIKERELEYWPGIKLEDIVPDEYDPRPPVQGTDGWVKNNGYGLYFDADGNPVIKHGFMAKTCTSDHSCQNTDICVKARCVPAIFNGTAVAEAQAQLKSSQAKKQQLMFNMVYEHHEMPPMAFGGGGGGGGGAPDDGTLPEIDSSAKADMKSAGQNLASDKSGIWYDPYSGYGNTGLAARDFQLKQKVEELEEVAAAQSKEVQHLSLLRSQQAALEEMHSREMLKQQRGHLQALAMGGGTPLDLSFGVGKDGEPPYRIRSVAESVRNGILDPNAPETLPYAQVKGSGTSNQIATVGFLNPLPPPIDGTVA